MRDIAESSRRRQRNPLNSADVTSLPSDPNIAYLTPEAKARVEIDRMLAAAGWVVQDYARVNLSAARGVAVREFVLKSPHGRADYLLFVDDEAVGVAEAKKEGETLTGVAWQTAKYVDGIPDELPTAVEGALPFAYQSTGVETRFTSTLDPDAKSRQVFWFHRPETLAGWINDIRAHPLEPTLRHRLRTLPVLENHGLWPAQERAIRGLEESLALDRPRALIQMATGAGKTFTAANIAYRLVKFADARRILFLVDRANLGRQTLKEFQSFTTPDDGRKFAEQARSDARSRGGCSLPPSALRAEPDRRRRRGRQVRAGSSSCRRRSVRSARPTRRARSWPRCRARPERGRASPKARTLPAARRS